jgi:hypothetical protein
VTSLPQQQQHRQQRRQQRQQALQGSTHVMAAETSSKLNM